MLAEYTVKRKSKGIGLENVKKRLQHLYFRKHDLTIINENDTYEISLTMQLKPIQ
jgi:LytS/YehU family sensor histidine kinase